MNIKNPYQLNDALLREQMEQFIPEFPDGVWEGMESQLDQLNQNLQFDDAMRQGAEQFQPQVPQGVWEAVQGGIQAGAAGTGAGLSLAGKWILGALIGGTVIGSGIWMSQRNAVNESAPVVEQKVPVQTDVQEETQEPQVQSPSQSGQTHPGPETNKEYNASNAPDNSAVSAGVEDHDPQIADPAVREPVSGSGGEGGASNTANGSGGVVPTPPAAQPASAAISFTAADTFLCDGSQYRVLLVGSDATKWRVKMNGVEIAQFGAGRQEFAFTSVAGIYYFEYIWSHGGMQGKSAQQLVVAPRPKSEMAPALDLGEGNYEYEASGVGSMQWWLDGKRIAEGRSCRFRLFDQGPAYHNLQLITVSEQGCRDTLTDRFENTAIVKVSEPVIPNVFSPNGDGINDVYRVDVAGASYFRMRIYNQENQLVFTTDDPTQGWDGRDPNRGNTIHAGQYLCIIEYALAGGEIKPEKVNVTLNPSKP